MGSDKRPGRKVAGVKEMVNRDSRRPSWRVFLSAAVIAAAVAAAYHNSFQGPFILDDDSSILNNPSIRQLSWNVFDPPGEGRTVQGRPILNASFAINYAIGRTGVTGYHVANLLIHVLAALTLLSLVRRTLLLESLRPAFGPHAMALAMLVTLAWAVHPLQTESVTYISQRAESLASLFYLLTLYCALRGAESRRPWVWQAAAVAACALGMGAKEIVVTAPVVVLLYDRAFVAGSLRAALRRRWRFYLALAATWAVLAWLLVRTSAQGGTALQGHAITRWQYARTQFGVILHYLAVAIWPSHASQCLDSCWPIANGIWAIALSGGAVACLVAVAGWLLWRNRPAGFVAASFFLILAPTSSVVPIVDLAWEHRMYLPLAAVATLGVFAGHALCRRLAAKAVLPPRTGYWILAMAAVLAIAVLGYRTCIRNQDYATAKAIWQDTVDKCPWNHRALRELGCEYCDAGDIQTAIELLNRSIELDPGDGFSYTNRGACFERSGQYALAVADYDMALRLKISSWLIATVHFNRGTAYEKWGQPQKAIADYALATELRPDLLIARKSRGRVNFRLAMEARKTNDADKVADYCRLALDNLTAVIQADCNDCDAYFTRTFVYYELGRFEEALSDATETIRLRPLNASYYNNRAIIYFKLRRFDLALQDARDCHKLGGQVDPAIMRSLEQATSQPG